MFRIDGPGAGPGNSFVEGIPNTATQGTVVTGPWAQAVQDELLNAIEASGLAADKNDSTQLLQAIRALGAGGGSNPVGLGANLLINGDFRIFQRALTAPGGILTRALGVALTAYGLDRWQSSSDGGGGAGSASVSRQVFTPGQTLVPNFPRNYLSHAQTIAATVAAPFARQKIEDVTGIGGTVTLTAWIKASTAVSVTMRTVQNFGSGGSADVIASTDVQSVTTSWQRIRKTVALPSVTGKTIGAGNYLSCEFLFPTGATYTIDIADVQLQPSPTPTAFQRRALSVEVELARRYFEKSWPLDVQAATCPASLDGATIADVLNGTGEGSELLTRFRVEKRDTPTVKWFAPSTQVVDRIDNGGDKAVSSTTDTGPASTGAPVGAFSTALSAAHWTADAEL